MKSEYQEYKETGMLGSYQPGHAVLRREKDGVRTTFRDACGTIVDDKMQIERGMWLGGKTFRITSIFPLDAPSTPTDKLLLYIDSQQSKAADLN